MALYVNRYTTVTLGSESNARDPTTTVPIPIPQMDVPRSRFKVLKGYLWFNPSHSNQINRRPLVFNPESQMRRWRGSDGGDLTGESQFRAQGHYPEPASVDAKRT
jgi:hypothetical protein